MGVGYFDGLIFWEEEGGAAAGGEGLGGGHVFEVWNGGWRMEDGGGGKEGEGVYSIYKDIGVDVLIP